MNYSRCVDRFSKTEKNIKKTRNPCSAVVK